MRFVDSFDRLVTVAAVMRAGFFVFGLFQDAYMDVKYTDIDYAVFTDAAKYVFEGSSPYLRETYRYTPVLALLLTPNYFVASFGKVLFMLCDLFTGVLIYKILMLDRKMSVGKAVNLSSIWLLNPMVVTISSRGNAESVLTVIVMAFLYEYARGDMVSSGFLAGLAVHFKIYPVIYIPSVIFSLQSDRTSVLSLVNWNSVRFAAASAAMFATLTTVMYFAFEYEFLYETYLYHLVRIDHRHNFSLYNLCLYFSSAAESSSAWRIESVAFVPQLLFSAVLIPWKLAPIDLISTLFVQTFAFIAFNKVITSQYFIWFLCFLPFYLKDSKLCRTERRKGVACVAAWVAAQALWLYHAYHLEFLGESTFYPGLFYSSCLFFAVNVVLVGVFIDDVRKSRVKLD